MERIDQTKEIIKERNRVIETKTKECHRLEKEKNAIELKNKELEHAKKSLIENLNHLFQKVCFVCICNYAVLYIFIMKL